MSQSSQSVDRISTVGILPYQLYEAAGACGVNKLQANVAISYRMSLLGNPWQVEAAKGL